jgi:hypothetical protein
MKKLLLILILCVSLSSCVKVIPNSCGVVSGYGTIQCTNWGCYYYLPIRYDGGYIQQVQVSEYDWYYYQPGYYYCR